MSNSDQPLSKPEADRMAYLDGSLTPEQATAYEREYPDAAVEKAEAEKLRALLKSSKAPVLRNADFLNRQILREISSAPQVKARSAMPLSFWRLWLPRAACLVLGGVLAWQMVKPANKQSRTASEPAYLAQVLSVTTDDPSVKSQVVQDEGITVVKLEGLEPISEEYILN